MRLWPVAFLCLMAPPAMADDLLPICADRPGRGSSACTVEAGHFQVEAGLYDETFQRRAGVTTNFTVAASPLLKYGVSESLDLEAGISLFQMSRVHDANGTVTGSGIGDLYLHAKWNPLAGQDGPLTFVLDPYLKLPTASGGSGNGRVEGGLVAPVSYDLGSGWSATFTGEGDALANASGQGVHFNASGDAAISRAFANGLTLGADFYAGQNFDPSGTVPQYSFDLSAAYLTDNDTQLDCGVNLGLNRATPDMELYVGVSRRF